MCTCQLVHFSYLPLALLLLRRVQPRYIFCTSIVRHSSVLLLYLYALYTYSYAIFQHLYSCTTIFPIIARWPLRGGYSPTCIHIIKRRFTYIQEYYNQRCTLSRDILLRDKDRGFCLFFRRGTGGRGGEGRRGAQPPRRRARGGAGARPPSEGDVTRSRDSSHVGRRGRYTPMSATRI